MADVLLVVDFQNDFIDGVLGTKEAEAIVPSVIEKIKNFDGTVLFTRDTHFENYLETQEGINLPVEHCIKGTFGWQIRKEVDALRTTDPIDKPGFGSDSIGYVLRDIDEEEKIDTITVIGLCTDICVIVQALLAKTFLPETEIIVDASCCAGITPQSHKNALEAMKMCQIRIIGE